MESWPRLSERVGLQVVAKRDDVSGLGLGGNKVRKLDLILGRARQEQVEVVVTVGGVQSNHCRITSAVAARLGLQAVVYLQGPPPPIPAGNLLLDHLFGAEVHVVDGDATDQIERRCRELAESGRRVLNIPLGGGTPLGTFAYALAVAELRGQLGIEPDQPYTTVLAAGTGNTLAGITLGAYLFWPALQVVGVSVSRPADQLREDVRTHVRHACVQLGLPEFSDDVTGPTVTEDYIGSGYTIPGPGTATAVRLLARTEGVLTDLTYTGKALEALVDLARTGTLTGPVVFWHTGGFPELFARPVEAVIGPLVQP